jgi:hypothetical protein
MDGRPLLGNAYVSPMELPRPASESFSTNTAGDRVSVGCGKLRHLSSHPEVSLEHCSGAASDTARVEFIPKFSFRTCLYQFFSHFLYPFSLLWLIPTRTWRSLQLQAFVPGQDKAMFIAYQVRTVAVWILYYLRFTADSDCESRLNSRQLHYCVEYSVWFLVPFTLYLSDILCIVAKYAMMSPQNYQSVLDGTCSSRVMSQFEMSKWLFPTVSVLIREINTMAIITGVPVTAELFKFDFSASYCSNEDDDRASSHWNDLRRTVYGETEADGSTRVEIGRFRWAGIRAMMKTKAFQNVGNSRKGTNDTSTFYRWLKMVSILFPFVPAMPFSNLAVLDTSKRALATVPFDLQMDDVRLPGAMLLTSVEHRSRVGNFRLCCGCGHAITPQSYVGWLVSIIDMVVWTLLNHVASFKFTKGAIPTVESHPWNRIFEYYTSFEAREWVFFIVSLYLRAIYLRLFVKNVTTVMLMYQRRAKSMTILDTLVKPRSRAFLPKDNCVMNEILTVPPLLQLNSTEDVVTFVHARSLLRKLGRQYKTRSALFFAQQIFVVIIVCSTLLHERKDRKHSEAAYGDFQMLLLLLSGYAFGTFACILFYGAKLNYSSKLVGDYLYAQENDVRRDVSRNISESQVLNTTLNVDIVRKRELADVLHLAVSRIQNQEPVKVLGFIPATFSVLSAIPPVLLPAVYLFNDLILANEGELMGYHNLTTTR